MPIYQVQNSIPSSRYEAIVYDDFFFQPHLHRHYELVLPLEGAVTVSVEERSERIRPGQGALVLPHQVHSFRSEAHTRVLVIILSPDHITDADQALKGLVGTRSAFTPDPNALLYALPGLLADDLPALSRNARLGALCAEYIEKTPLIPAPELANSAPARRLLEYISLHYREPVTLAAAAQALGYDRAYLSRSLHRLTGTNFRRLLNAARMDCAESLIRSTTLSMTEIALESGFQSIRTFNRARAERLSRPACAAPTGSYVTPPSGTPHPRGR